MSDAITYLESLEDTTGKLSEASRHLHEAADELDKAEKEWDEARDAVFEDLKDEMANADRKGDPAEHVVTSTARRLHRDKYIAWRQAKRQVETYERVSSNRRAELSGWQSLLKSEHAEAGVQDHFNQREGRPSRVPQMRGRPV